MAYDISYQTQVNPDGVTRSVQITITDLEKKPTETNIKHLLKQMRNEIITMIDPDPDFIQLQQLKNALLAEGYTDQQIRDILDQL